MEPEESSPEESAPEDTPNDILLVGGFSHGGGGSHVSVVAFWWRSLSSSELELDTIAGNPSDLSTVEIQSCSSAPSCSGRDIIVFDSSKGVRLELRIVGLFGGSIAVGFVDARTCAGWEGSRCLRLDVDASNIAFFSLNAMILLLRNAELEKL
jgi:hypothetical protein